MKYPCCGNEMESGVVQGARTIFLTTKEHKNWLLPDAASGQEVTLSSHNWMRPTCKAYHCAFCRKVEIDYAEQNLAVHKDYIEKIQKMIRKSYSKENMYM